MPHQRKQVTVRGYVNVHSQAAMNATVGEDRLAVILHPVPFSPRIVVRSLPFFTAPCHRPRRLRQHRVVYNTMFDSRIEGFLRHAATRVASAASNEFRSSSPAPVNIFPSILP